MLAFVQTLFDIVRLRKGPEHIPRSRLLLFMAISMWLIAVLAQIVLLDRRNEADIVNDLMSLLLSIICYAAILVSFGKGERLVQTVTAALGCSSLLIFALSFGYVLAVLIGSSALMELVFLAYLGWAVSVKGHIIARAIDRHWYLGLVFAVLIFLLQYVALIYYRTN